MLNSFENSENLKLALSNYSDKQRGVTFQLKLDSKNDVEVIYCRRKLHRKAYVVRATKH